MDINGLKTYQQVNRIHHWLFTCITVLQVVLYIWAMIATPIFIHTLVVFVRLYWFHRRFKNIVRESRNWRRSRSRARTEPREDPESAASELGVNGRNIVVLHANERPQPDSGADVVVEKAAKPESASSVTSSMSQGELAELRDRPGDLPPHRTPSHQRDVAFAERVPSQESVHAPSVRLPQRLCPEQHIAFLENQRNPKDKETLRIPGPREFDRGHLPENLTVEPDGAPLSHQVTNLAETRAIPGDFPVRRQITIEAPDHPRIRPDTGAFSKLSRRKTVNSDQTKMTTEDEIVPPPPRLQTRAGTISSLRRWGTKDEAPMPYLSWQPTIGRNSAFVDLTEEQRDELGGIEYRSLKTLAAVLVG